MNYNLHIKDILDSFQLNINSFLENVVLQHNYRVNYERVLLLKSQTFWEVVAENMGQEWEELACKGSGLGYREE